MGSCVAKKKGEEGEGEGGEGGGGEGESLERLEL